jgi:Tol biopolymer transport system component/DNA-binding winged helix-turn-helix (wHTH) protein
MFTSVGEEELATLGGPVQSAEERTPHIARFGVFELNVRAAELLRQGTRLKTQEQPLRVLQYLVERAGELVTREDLQTHLWPDGTFVDFEHSLNTAIKKLRQTLGDDADNPRFIETVPRRGYRFIAPVEWVGMQMVKAALEPAASATAATHYATAIASTNRETPSRTKLWLALAVALVLVGALWMYSMRRSSHRTISAPISVKPLTSYPGTEDFGMLSPDGQQVAFVWDEGTNVGGHIYVKQVGSERPLQLTHGDKFADLAPTWSPDGKYIAFQRMALDLNIVDATADIIVMPALGGSERKVATVHMISNLAPCASPNMSWSPDGKTIAFMDRAPVEQNFAIFQLSLDTLERKQLTKAPVASLGDAFPAYSPDGKTLAFVRTTKESADVFSVPSDGGVALQLTSENHVTLMGLAWTQDGKSIVYGGFGIWIVPAEGGKSRQLFQTQTAGSPTIRGDKLVYTVCDWEENIWSAPLGGKQIHGGWRKEFASTHAEEGLRFSPDGNRVAFQSTRTDNFEIWVSDLDGSNPLRLTNYNGPLTGSPRWSPDGQTIAYDSRPDGNADVFVVSSNGGQPKQLTHDASDEVMPSFSHDGKRIYFSSDRTGSWNVYSMPVDGGAVTQVTTSGGFTALESPDGKYLYYAKGVAQPGLWVVPVEGGEEKEVIPNLQPTLYGYWVMVDDGIYFASYEQLSSQTPKSALNFYSFKTQKTTRITALPWPAFSGAPGLEISPDRKRIFVVMVQTHGADLKIADNVH